MDKVPRRKRFEAHVVTSKPASEKEGKKGGFCHKTGRKRPEIYERARGERKVVPLTEQEL